MMNKVIAGMLAVVIGYGAYKEIQTQVAVHELTVAGQELQARMAKAGQELQSNLAKVQADMQEAQRQAELDAGHRRFLWRQFVNDRNSGQLPQYR